MPSIPINGTEKCFLVDDIDHLPIILLGPFCLAGKGYVRTTSGTPQDYVHHLIAARMGLVGFETIDHDNRDKLDNRRFNIKDATYSENLINRGLVTLSTSGHKHVVWSSQKNKWQVEICRNSFRKHLGFFSQIKDAVEARDKFLSTSDVRVNPA